jgi:hypothetical protein
MAGKNNKKRQQTDNNDANKHSKASPAAASNVDAPPVTAPPTMQPLSVFSMKTGAGQGPPLHEVVVHSGNTPSVVTSEYTSSELYEIIRKKGRMGSEAMLVKDLVMFVRNDLFPKLKFFMHSRQLMFSTATDTICYQICSDLGLTEMRASAWWELHKNKMVKTLNSKRADVTSAIKRIFVSKSGVVDSIVRYNLQTYSFFCYD